MNDIKKVFVYELPIRISATLWYIPFQIQDLIEPSFLRNIKGQTLRDNDMWNCSCKASLSRRNLSMRIDAA